VVGAIPRPLKRSAGQADRYDDLSINRVKTSDERRDWVLVADGSRRSGDQGRAALAAVRALGAAGFRPAVTVSSRFSLAGRSRYCSRRVAVPPVTDEGFLPALRNELASRPYLACLPVSDAVQIMLDAPGAEFLDKEQLAISAQRAGIPTPPSRSFDSSAELVAAADDLEYPVVVKPVVHTYDPFRANSPVELTKKIVQEGPVVVQPFLTEQIRSLSGVVWKGTLTAAVHSVWLRIWPSECGSASAAETVAPDFELEDRMATLLRGYDGIFNAQFIGNYLLDLHPRIYGTHSLAMAAGVNQVAIYCDLLRGGELPAVRGKAGAFYRWLEGDLRLAYTLVRKRELSLGVAFANLRPRRGAAHSIESIGDPGPLLARLSYSTRRLRMSAEERRAGQRLAG
jgi:hypothetical protein